MRVRERECEVNITKNSNKIQENVRDIHVAILALPFVPLLTKQPTTLPKSQISQEKAERTPNITDTQPHWWWQCIWHKQTYRIKSAMIATSLTRLFEKIHNDCLTILRYIRTLASAQKKQNADVLFSSVNASCSMLSDSNFVRDDS